jgi:hypothetical protein
MSLTDQVSKAQVKNILAKLKAGKTISRHEQSMIAQYEAGTAPDLTLEQVAEHYGLSRPGVLRWKRSMAKLGLPWTSFEAIDKWREAKSKEATPGDINSVKKQKLEREVKRLDLKIAVDEGRLIERDSVKETCIQVAAVWCSELDALVGDLPGQLAGLSEAQIQPKLRARIELLKTNARTFLKAYESSC